MSVLWEIISRDKFVIEHGSHVMDAIMIVLDGSFSFSVHGRGYTAKKYDICVFPKDTLFERIVHQKIRCLYFQFDSFPVSLSSGILESADTARTENTIRHLDASVKEQNHVLTKHLVEDILYFLQKPSVVKIPDDSSLAKCIEYISENYGSYISLDDLALRFSLSKQALIQRFKRHTQKTPMQYLLFVRIEAAKLMLKSTKLSIGEIAESCGFDNIYYFSNRFKLATGISPSEYRARITDEIKRF